MKRISLIAAAAVAVLAATGAHARSLEDIQKDGTIRLATEGYYAPFAYFEGKQLTGFEVELAELMAQKGRVEDHLVRRPAHRPEAGPLGSGDLLARHHARA